MIKEVKSVDELIKIVEVQPGVFYASLRQDKKTGQVLVTLVSNGMAIKFEVDKILNPIVKINEKSTEEIEGTNSFYRKKSNLNIEIAELLLKKAELQLQECKIEDRNSEARWDLFDEIVKLEKKIFEKQIEFSKNIPQEFHQKAYEIKKLLCEKYKEIAKNWEDRDLFTEALYFQNIETRSESIEHSKNWVSSSADCNHLIHPHQDITSKLKD